MTVFRKYKTLLIFLSRADGDLKIFSVWMEQNFFFYGICDGEAESILLRFDLDIFDLEPGRICSIQIKGVKEQIFLFLCKLHGACFQIGKRKQVF